MEQLEHEGYCVDYARVDADGRVDADHWSSKEMFADHFGAIFDPRAIAGKTVAEVGSGSSRIVNM